jgi:hypothetical protein
MQNYVEGACVEYMGRLKTKRMGNNFPGWLYVLEAGLEWNGASERNLWP